MIKYLELIVRRQERRVEDAGAWLNTDPGEAELGPEQRQERAGSRFTHQRPHDALWIRPGVEVVRVVAVIDMERPRSGGPVEADAQHDVEIVWHGALSWM